MRTFLLIAALALTRALDVRADVAMSFNYTIVAEAIDGGGGFSSSTDYTQDLAIGEITGRSVAAASDVMMYGLMALLNNPPIARDDLRSHPVDEPALLPSIALFANDSDPENDSFHLLKWDQTTALGGHVTLVGTDLRYDPPLGLRQADQFTYTIIDDNGDTAKATVTMLIAPNDISQVNNSVAAYPMPDGKVLLRFKQNPGGKEYRIEFATNLRAPDWQLISSTASGDGIVEIVIDPTQSQQGYYRASVVF